MSQQAASTHVREKHPLSMPTHHRQSLEGLHREIDRLLSQFGQNFAQSLGQSISPREPLWWHTVPWGAAAPIVDVAESEEAFELTTELPGVHRQDLELKVSNDTLSIKGEK